MPTQEAKVLFCLSSPTFLPLILLKSARLTSGYCITSSFGDNLDDTQELFCGCAVLRGAETRHKQNLTSEMISSENMLNETTKDKLESTITIYS